MYACMYILSKGGRKKMKKKNIMNKTKTRAKQRHVDELVDRAQGQAKW